MKELGRGLRSIRLDFLALFAAAFAPGLFWLWYFYRKDKLEPEPKTLIIKTFLIGILLGIPATFLEFLFTESLVVTIVIAPLIEEALKYGGVRFTVYQKAEFDEPLDGIIYTAALALGFASMENWLYLFAAYLGADEAAEALDVLSPFGVVASVFIVRALLSVPSHVLYSSMWGYALGKAKFTDLQEGRALIRRGFLLAVFCHGLFNFFASNLPGAALGEVMLVAAMWWIILRRIGEGLKASPHRSHGLTSQD